MSIERSFRASFQIVNLSGDAGGSGVAVWRDTSNNYLYIATAYHVVEGMTNGLFVDYLGRKYTNYNFIVLDKTYDFALVELRNVPTTIQPVTIAARNSNTITYGADVYVIGWPLLFDKNSVSTGTIRSSKWNSNGVMNQILISAPTFGGNSGGGVFHKQTHQLVGVVSWGLTNDETLNGIVPHTIILEALFYFMYRPTLITPAQVSGESYILGIKSSLIDPFTMYGLDPSLSPLNTLGSAGLIVLSVLPSSPALTAGFTDLSNANNSYTFDIIWGIRKIGGNYTYINEENSLDSILYSLYATPNHTRRKILSRRSRGESTNIPLNIILPTTLQIECLTSRVVNNLHNNIFETKQVTLVKRDVYYATNGEEDPSSFRNEFMFGIRNEINKQLQTKEISLKEYGNKYLDIIHKNLTLKQE